MFNFSSLHFFTAQKCSEDKETTYANRENGFNIKSSLKMAYESRKPSEDMTTKWTQYMLIDTLVSTHKKTLITVYEE